ncbi:MAG: GNAT family N-acetyltransferase [Ktedonobacterales bacterium]|nr:GNAT family N-acetyltransferase [Ktedonobacterales bacterium]
MILRTLSAPALVHAIEENLAEYVLYQGRAPGAEVYQDAALTWVISGIPGSAYSNAVLRTRLAPARVDAVVAEVLARFSERGVPLGWWITPATRPTNLAERLAAHGLEALGEGPGMAADLAALTGEVSDPAGLSIEEVNHPPTLRLWLDTQHRATSDGEGSPSGEAVAAETHLGVGPHLAYRRFLGRLDGVPVATAALFLGAGVAGIYSVATLPSARRQGIGAAMTRAPLRAARALGYRAAVLGASPLGAPVYTRLGFREYCRVGRFVRWPA